MTLYFAQLDVAKNVVSVGKASVADEQAYLAACGGTQITEAQYRTLRASPGRRHSLTDDTLTDVTPTPEIATLREQANVRIDAAAEQARLVWITPGAGQAMEYLATQAQAVAASLAPDPLDPALYPWLVAEQQARAMVGNTLTLRAVTTAIAAQVQDWSYAGSTIKRLRRTAKLEVDAALDGAAIEVIIAAISWPTP